MIDEAEYQAKEQAVIDRLASRGFGRGDYDIVGHHIMGKTRGWLVVPQFLPPSQRRSEPFDLVLCEPRAI